MEALWQALQGQTGDADFGLHLGEAFAGLSQGHVLFAVMSNCPTVGSALEKFFRYHDLMADTIRPCLLHEGSVAVCRFSGPAPGIPLHRHHSEAALAMVATIIRRLAGERARLAGVRFRHAAPPDTGEHRRLFGAPLLFDAGEDALLLPISELERPILPANREFLEAYEKLARALLKDFACAGSAASKTRESIGRAFMGGNRPRIAEIARQLAVSKRKLQFDLKLEKTSFRKLLDETRREMAEGCLAEPGTAIVDVAFLLGFSEQSALNHAFKRWTGVSPRQFCKARRIDRAHQKAGGNRSPRG